ncbi:IclR family transcriptional regulator [Pacificibacter marinus]|uniref:Transcriptional regulator KdgR n=1 Tax=Pacificibacter marinus TaxID=658057 RepID=A0A1Y5SF34_9RHOB|nr:IclR family transcriptional regulator [Pacificibacter marinus]SEK48116.1 transcriptional regulator, IclR family [Pacificibacter marinus]SLN36258.1 Transcriptional regulator KdgR [Pacificibacter marinus]
MSSNIDDPIDDEKYRAPALSKGLDILELLASKAEGMTQVDIAKTLGRTTSEIFRMLMVLRTRGYVELAEDGDRYSLTTKMFEVAHRHPPIKRLTSIAGEAMQRLADRINQSLHLGILHSGKILVVAQVDCQDNNVTSVRLGAHIPIVETASGRVMASTMDDDALQKLLTEAGDVPADKYAAFMGDLPDVAKKGYCESPSLTIEGVLNISAPIYDFSGRAVGAITIPFIRRLSGTSIVSAEESREALILMCANISRKLGAGVR